MMLLFYASVKRSHGRWSAASVHMDVSLERKEVENNNIMSPHRENI